MRGLRRLFGSPAQPASAPATLDELLAQRVADHFDHPTIDGSAVDTGMAGLRVQGRVADAPMWGPFQTASLSFDVSGGRLGPETSFASISGYAADAHGREGDVARAVVEGACLWTCTLRSIARSAFTSEAPDPTAAVRDVTIHGRRFRLHVDRIDRFFTLGNGAAAPDADLFEDVRRHVSRSGWLIEAAAEQGTLPPLVSDQAALVSAFSSHADGGSPTVEVKVRGADWLPSLDGLRIPEVGHPDVLVSLRELGILVPVEPVALDRATVERSLSAIAAYRSDTFFQPAGWRGWRTHGGRLGAPLTPRDLDTIEAETGQLPADYRSFLTEVGGSGAGPGYGLLAPRLVDGVVPVAHAGCGVWWVLRLDGAARGEIWIDARGCDGTYRRIAASFRDWYAEWLDASFGSANPWTQWDSMQCACASSLAKAVEAASVRERSERRLTNSITRMTVTSAGPYVPAGTVVDPTHACVALFASWGIDEAVFVRGVNG